MAATIPLSEAEKRKPGFIEGRPTGTPWVLTVRDEAGEYTFETSDWEARSKFGSVRNVVACDRDGSPSFERPEYREAPNVNVIAYGVRGGQAHIAILHEARPHADNPTDPTNTKPIVFGQIPMGFLEKVLGKDALIEDGKLAATREVAEETGGTAVIKVTQPKFPHHNPSPNFVATWSELWFVEVDLDQVEAARPDRGEQIYKAEYVPAAELLHRIRDGVYEGAVYRAGTSLSLLMIFFTTFPQFFPRE